MAITSCASLLTICLLLQQSAPQTVSPPATPPTTPTTPPATTAPTVAAGFVAIFDGKTLDGWTSDTNPIKGYVVENGAITCLPDGVNLRTVKKYANFHLKFDFQLTAGANNGIGIRMPKSGDAAYLGMEIQVLDNTATKYADLKPWQYHGSIYGVVPAKREFLKPIGQWNSQEIIADGSHIQVILNGTTIVDADIQKPSIDGTIDGHEHPGLRRQSGFIGFCGHGDRVAFTNLQIKELP